MSVHDALKQLIFGNQKQAEKMNDTIVSVLLQNLKLNNAETLESDIINYLSRRFKLEGREEVCVPFLVGTDEAQYISENHTVKVNHNKETGKTVFHLIPSTMTDMIPEENKSDSSLVENSTVDQLIQRMLPIVPQAVKDELQGNEAAQCLYIAETYFSSI